VEVQHLLFRYLDKLRERKMKNKGTAPVQSSFDVVSEWRNIEDLVAIGNPSNLKEAVIRSDKLLDLALSTKVVGETLGQKLKNAKELFDDPAVYQGLWEAHKIRNALVHEVNFDLPHYVAKGVIEKFRHGITHLGIKL